MKKYRAWNCQTWKSFFWTEYLGMLAGLLFIAFARWEICDSLTHGVSTRGGIVALVGGCFLSIFCPIEFVRNFRFLKRQRSTANQWPSRHFTLAFLPVALMLVVDTILLLSFLEIA